jgi:hypothetical protein
LLKFAEMPLPWWTRWLIGQGPEAMMVQMSNRMAAAITDALGGADSDVDLVYVNGHPALQVSLSKVHPLPKNQDKQPAALENHGAYYETSLVVWSGEAMVMASVAGSQPVTQDDPFLRSVTTRIAGVPGDPDEQLAWMCKLGGILVLVLVVAFFAMVYAIDKTIKRLRARRT